MIISHSFLLNIDKYIFLMKLLYHFNPLLREVTVLVINLFSLIKKLPNYFHPASKIDFIAINFRYFEMGCIELG